MANCIWTSVVEYIRSATIEEAYLSPTAAEKLFDAVCSMFGWMAVGQITESEDPWTQKVSYEQGVRSAYGSGRLTRCGLSQEFEHQCDYMKVEFVAPGNPVEGTRLAKKFLVDYLRQCAAFLMPHAQMDNGAIGDNDQDAVVNDENVTIHADKLLESEWVETLQNDDIKSITNTAETYTFPELLGRDILIQTINVIDLGRFDSKSWVFPQDYLDAECTPNTLPFQAMVYGEYDLEVSIKVNAHKFTSGLFYLSVLPDPVMLNKEYESALVSLQRQGMWIDLSQAPTGVLKIPFEYRRTFVRNLAKANEATGVTPAIYTKVHLHCIVPVGSGSGMDKQARLMVFCKMTRASMSGMGMKMPIAQGPIRTFVQPFRDFAGYVKQADEFVGQALDFLNADKPPMLQQVGPMVPRPRMFFPNSKGVTDSTILRSDPSSTDRLQPALPEQVESISSIARIWGYLADIEWSPNQDVGDELIRIPLDPSYFMDKWVDGTETVSAPPPISLAVRMCALWTGPIEFDIIFAGTSFHSGSLTISYEFGRTSSTIDKKHCQAYSYKYDVFDLGEKRRITVEVPYVYDTPWRRTATQGPNLTYETATPQGIGGLMICSVNERNEAYMTVRVANQLKAADTVQKNMKGIVRVRAGSTFATIGLTSMSGRIVGGLNNGNGNMKTVRTQRKNPVDTKINYMQRSHAPDRWGVEEYKPEASVAAGDKLEAIEVARSVDKKKMEECLAEQSKASRDAKELSSLREQVAQLRIKVSEPHVVQQDEAIVSRCKRIEQELEAYKIYSHRKPYKKWEITSDTTVDPTKIVNGQALYQETFGGAWIPTSSQAFREAAEAGQFRSRVEWRDVPRAQAPTRDDTTLDEQVVKRIDPLSTTVGEGLSVMDILRRPMQIIRGLSVEPHTVGKTGQYGCWAIPVTPPTWNLMSANNAANALGQTAALCHPSIGITSMYRHWRGGNDYILSFYGLEDVYCPIYVSHVPHTGAILSGNLGATPVGSENFNRLMLRYVSTMGNSIPLESGGLESLGYATDIVIPHINPTTHVTAPYYSQNNFSTLNSSEWAFVGPERDLTDSYAGAVVVYSAKKFTFDAWWTAGVDFQLRTFIGTTRAERLGMSVPDNDDTDTRYTLGQMPRAQMWGVVSGAALAGIAIQMVPWTRVAGRVAQTTESTLGIVTNLHTASNKVNGIVTIMEKALVEGTQGIDQAVQEVTRQMQSCFPQLETATLLVTAGVDAWMLTQHQDVPVIVNVVTRWLISAGLITGKTLMSSAASLTQYFAGVVRPRAQINFATAFTQFRNLIMSLECFKGCVLTKSLAKFLDDVIFNHRIMKIVWVGRALAALMDFIKCLYSLIKKFIYWIRGGTDPSARIYYALTERNSDLDAFIKKVQKYMLPETERLIKISPKARFDFYTMLMVANQVERAMLTGPKEANNPGLTHLLAAFKKKARTLANTLYTAPVKYEPMMVQFYGETNVGKSYLAGHLVQRHMKQIGVPMFAKPIIYRTPGQEFWTDVDGAEVAVVVDEATHLDTEQDNRGLVADVFMLKSPARSNPNQASEEKKDVCINPVLGIFLCNVHDPVMNEVRDPAAMKRRFDCLVQVIRVKPGYFADFSHLNFKIVARKGEDRSLPTMSADQFFTWYDHTVKGYHDIESEHVKYRTKELLTTIQREEEMEFVLRDPWSVYFRHLYGVQSQTRAEDINDAMENCVNSWLADTGSPSAFAHVVAQGPETRAVVSDPVPKYIYTRIAEAAFTECPEEEALQIATDALPMLDEEFLARVKDSMPMRTAPYLETIVKSPSLEVVEESNDLLGLSDDDWMQVKSVLAQGGRVFLSCSFEQHSGYVRAERAASDFAQEIRENKEAWTNLALNLGVDEAGLTVECFRRRQLRLAGQTALKRRDVTLRDVEQIRQVVDSMVELERQIDQQRLSRVEAEAIVATIHEEVNADTTGQVAEFVQSDAGIAITMVQAVDAISEGCVDPHSGPAGAKVYDESVDRLKPVMERAVERIHVDRTALATGSRNIATTPLSQKEKAQRALVKEVKEKGYGAAYERLKAIRAGRDPAAIMRGENVYRRYDRKREDYLAGVGEKATAYVEETNSDSEIGWLTCLQAWFREDEEINRTLNQTLGAVYGDCVKCTMSCVPVVKVCTNEDCFARYMCVNCTMREGEMMECSACHSGFVNPMNGKRLHAILKQWLFGLACVRRMSWRKVVFGFISAIQTWFLGPTPVARLSFWVGIIRILTGNVTMAYCWWALFFYKWYKFHMMSPTSWAITKYLNCGIWHPLKDATKLTWNGIMYCCTKCRDRPAPRMQMPSPHDWEREGSINLTALASSADNTYQLGTCRAVSRWEHHCAHRDLFEDTQEEVLFRGTIAMRRRVKEGVSFQDGNWIIIGLPNLVTVPNRYCSEHCCLKEVYELTMLCHAYLAINDPVVVNMRVQEGDENAVPVQMIPAIYIRRTTFGNISHQIREFVEKFKGLEWWSKIKDAFTSSLWKIAAGVSVLVLVLAALYKLWKMLRPITDGSEDEGPIIQGEQVMAASQMACASAGGTLTRVKGVSARRLKARAQQDGGRNLTDIMGSVLNNQMIISCDHPHQGHLKLGAVAVVGQFILMPKHYQRTLSEAISGSITLQYMNSSVLIAYSYSDRDFRIYGDNDLMMMKGPPQLKLARDIRNHFKSEDYYANNGVSSKGYVAIPPVSKLPVFTLHRLNIGERLDSTSVIAPDGKNTYNILDSVSYNFSMDGACGSVVYQDIGVSPVIGIHVAGSGTYMDGKGYGIIITKEMIEDLISDYKTVVAQSMHMDLQPAVGTGAHLVDTNVDYLGVVPKEMACAQPLKTHIVPSVIADRIDHVPTRLPVPLGSKDGPYRGGWDTPLHAGIVNMGAEVEDIPTHEAGYVGAAMRQMFLPLKPLEVSPKPLNHTQAVIGTDKNYYDPIDLSTSAGWPFCKEKSPGDKTPWITISEDRTSVTLDPKLVQVMAEKSKLRREGLVPNTVFADIMKDERKSAARVKEKGSTRIISMSPLDFTLTVRIYFMHFMAAFMEHRDDFMHAVGITADGPQWAHLYHGLVKYNPRKVWTIDYKNFGPGFSTRAAEQAYSVITHWSKVHMTLTAGDKKEMDMIVRELLNSLHLYETVVYRQACGSPSGAAITVVINTLVNLYYIMWAFNKVAHKVPKLNALIQEKGLADAFRHVVGYRAYGDDGIGATIVEFEDVVNAQTLSAQLAELNVVATDGTKAGQVVPYTGWDEAIFLKRGFKEHPVRSGMYLAPLPEAIIKETAMFVHSSADATKMTSEVVGASLLNAYGRGPHFYSTWSASLAKPCAETGVAFPCVSWQDLDRLFFGDIRGQELCTLPVGGLLGDIIISDTVYEKADLQNVTEAKPLTLTTPIGQPVGKGKPLTQNPKVHALDTAIGQLNQALAGARMRTMQFNM
nr:MAG: polyprotein [Wufeng shrew iflavirus 2]